MVQQNNCNYLTLFVLLVIVTAGLIIACAPVPIEQPREHIQKQTEEIAATATMCNNVFDEYSTGTIADEELLFVYKPSSVALKKSNGIYLRGQDRELCLYLQFEELELQKDYVLQYNLYDPDNRLHSKENYNFIPDSLPYHAWNTKKLNPEDRKQLTDGAWSLKVTLNGRPLTGKVFVIHSRKESSDKAKRQFDMRIQAELGRGMFTDKLRKNGALYFCNNDCYRECYDVNRSTCLDELSPLVRPCIDRASDVEQPDLSGERESTFGSLWAACVMVEHALMKTDTQGNISDCVAQCPVDEEDARRILLQN